MSSSIIYMKEPPKSVECWYCKGPCYPDTVSQFGVAYYCFNHKPLEVFFRCVKRSVQPQETPSWFFNTIRITLKNLRLDHNFHSGTLCQLEKHRGSNY
jgi:hypothetical protein